MIPKLLPLVGACLIIAAPVSAWPQTQPGQGDPARGRRAFQETGCYACHGTVGQGGAWQGPKLAPDPISYDGFIAQLREPARAMPRYSRDVLSDAEAADIYAYLKSIRRGKPAAQIRILNP